MVVDEFAATLRAGRFGDLLSPCLLDDKLPFIFQPEQAAWDTFRAELARLVEVGPEDIRIVGSGRFGFSVKPFMNLKAYNEDKSDIDVVVVNEAQFDRLWRALLVAAYPRQPTSPPAGWLMDRQKELYTGWLSPLEIKLDVKIYGASASPALDFGDRWFDALKTVARHSLRRHRDIKGRLYRTWDHARFYHQSSLVSLRQSIFAR